MNRITDYKKLSEDIVSWIKDYATTNNIKSLVVGVSGGIDSAVISTLCAMTGLHTIPCIIPIHSSDSHMTLAIEHCKWLDSIHSRSTYGVFDMTAAFDAIMDNILNMKYNDHAQANTKSRLRMSVLYHVATDQYGIVVGTGNKVEDFGVGFYTKYGDGGVDISPIADLYKTEVRELGRYLGISQEILDAQPTDGLWGEQQRTDEECLGATYEDLEWVMEYGSDIDKWPDTDTTIGRMDTMRKLQVCQIYTKLHTQNQHKMLPIPIYKLSL